MSDADGEKLVTLLFRERDEFLARATKAEGAVASLEARIAELTRERDAGAKEAECFKCHRRCKWFDEQGAPWDRARAVGVRCADCGYVLCRDCAPQHFGKEFKRLRDGHAMLAASASTLTGDVLAARAERDEARFERDSYISAHNELEEVAKVARAERDEAVGLLRRAKPVLDEVASLSDNTSLENMIATDIDAYLARLAATAPEKETTPPGPYSGT